MFSYSALQLASSCIPSLLSVAVCVIWAVNRLKFNVTVEDQAKLALDQNVTVIIKGENYPAKISGINYQAVENADAAGGKIGATADLVERTDQMLLGHKAIVRID